MATNGHTLSDSAPRGAFILFEGGDRCGKTTQSETLVKHLQSRKVDAELWKFPDRQTGFGQIINAYLTGKCETDDAAIHLLFSANRWEKRQAMLAALSSGRTLVVDRYAYSGAAFTAAKGIPGLDLAWCKAPDSGLPAPDATIYLSMTPEAAAARGGYGSERYEKEAMQREVALKFQELKDATWHTVDASRSIEAVESDVRRIADATLDACQQGKALQYLWL